MQKWKWTLTTHPETKSNVLLWDGKSVFIFSFPKDEEFEKILAAQEMQLKLQTYTKVPYAASSQYWVRNWLFDPDAGLLKEI